MLYINVGVLLGIIVFFLLLICYQKLLYLYIVILFFSLLSLAFYLLKSIEIRVNYWKETFAA